MFSMHMIQVSELSPMLTTKYIYQFRTIFQSVSLTFMFLGEVGSLCPGLETCNGKVKEK